MKQPQFHLRSNRRNARAFTVLELIVIIFILLVLVGIFVPYLLKLRESDRRVRCAENLRTIWVALRNYDGANHQGYPRTTADPESPGYTAYTGPDGSNPFTAVKPNDVTASLWLLVREKLVDVQTFVCPSTDASADSLLDANGRAVEVGKRSNFRSPFNLSYSYASPFSAAPGYRLNDTLMGGFVLLADKNPGVDLATGSDVTAISREDSLLKQAMGNSRNHGRAGQNVLYAEGSVAFQSTPYCGVNQDNIYTAISSRPLDGTAKFIADSRGVAGKLYAPAHPADSYLVPTESDEPMPTGTTLPSSQPASQPATVPATQVEIPPVPIPTLPAVLPIPATVPSLPTTTPASQPATRPTTQP